MFKALISIVLFWLALITIPKNTAQLLDLSPVADSTQIEITPLLDSLGLLDGYKVHINTPICEVEQCYAVQLDLYCDAIGNFISFDTLKGEGLTKLDHIPFATEDYQRLQHILNDHRSILSSYQKEELVENTRESEIEGFTGATALEIKKNVIEGAVYSCYTLWHIAHGPLVDSLKARTALGLNRELVHKLLARNNQQVNYFLINYCTEQDFQQYLTELLPTIINGEGYYAKNALEKMPAKVLNSLPAQEFFSEHFDRLDYFAQVALLKKLEKESMSDSLKNTLELAMEVRSSLRNELIQELISGEQ